MSNKEYIGDSVYAEINPDYLILTTENGFGPSNTIYLEPAVLSNLLFFLESRRKHDRADNETKDFKPTGD